MATPSKKLSREERLEKKRVAERLRYEKMIKDPTKLAAQKEKNRQKYLNRKQKGQRKLISEMSDREKRQARKKWRIDSKTYYDKKKSIKSATKEFVRENTPHSMCDEDANMQQQLQPDVRHLRPRLAVGRKRAIIQRKKRNKELKIKDDNIRKLKAELHKYKKRYHRLKRDQKEQPQELTPCTKMTKLAEDPGTRKEVVKKALFGDVLDKQLSKNISNLNIVAEKRVANKILLGPIAEKNKIWKIKNRIITYKKIWNFKKQKQLNQKTRKTLKENVRKFMEDDKYSRLCSGKKEFITRTKIKKQKRYLLDTLRNIHKEFLKAGNTISYSMFSRLRPFWILRPKVTDHDTCMCTTHCNIQLLISALNTAKILKVTNYQDLLTSLCCDRYNERCLERTCDTCCNRDIPFFEDFDDTKQVLYKRWISSKEVFIDPKTNKQRTVKKQKKQTIESIAKELKIKLEQDLVTLLKHEMNIVHQYQTIKRLKESLTEKDVLVHMDFSENYNTKYGQEIQSFHFGGSRTQLSLHTVIVYLQGSTTSYCTVSTNLSHNVYAIWAHLKPILDELPTNVENLHCLSDGPVTQYRNLLMFYVLACKILDLCPQIINWTWNYSEAGHGKGAPDGIGAVCKRTADNIVSCGGDISNIYEFCGAIQSRCPNITVYVVTDSDINEITRLLTENQPDLITFNGTLKVHQVQGTAFLPRLLIMKSLSCFCDSPGCEHYKLGTLKYSSASSPCVDDIYENSVSNRSETDSPSIMENQLPTDCIFNLVHFKSSEIDDRSDVTFSSNNTLLNLEIPEVCDVPDIDIDPSIFFPNDSVTGSPTIDQTSKKPIYNLDDSTMNIRKRKHTIKKSSDLVKSKKTKTCAMKENCKGIKLKASQIKTSTTKKSTKKATKTGKGKRTTREKTEKESDDCFCLICGASYSDDTTGKDWIQCILCSQWAQTGCIKSSLMSFTCPECLKDCDYK